MPKRTDISSILVIGAGPTPSSRRGEGWGEGTLRWEPSSVGSIARYQEIVSYRCEDAIGVGEHVSIPETENAVAIFFDDRCSSGVARGVMLSAIQLDCQPGSPTGEIGSITVNLELADEFLALELARTEVALEVLFGVGLIGAQSARDWRQALPSQLSTPSPNPLPPGERAFSSLS
jgi:hypothetical protein